MWRNSYFLLILCYVHFVNKICEHTLTGFVLAFAFFIPVKLAKTMNIVLSMRLPQRGRLEQKASGVITQMAIRGSICTSFRFLP